VADADLSREEIADQLIEIIAKEGMVDKARITPDATLQTLELDSMSIVTILMVVEEKFNIYIPMDGSLSEASDLKSLIDTLTDRIQSSNA
jgi:acyl carrier protein